MEPLVQSQNLSVTLTTPLDADFVVDQIDVTEAISELYEVVIHVHTTESEIPFNDLLGEVVSATIVYANADTTPGDTARVFAGIVGRIHQRQTFVDKEGSTVAYYTFYVYPEFWRTQFNQDCRIFQDQSVQDITETLFGEHNVSDTTIDIQDLPDSTHIYCIQYNESVFHFLSRLWEEEGISYFFTHNTEGSSLTLINDTQSHIEPVDPDTIALQHFEKSTLILNAIQNITYEIGIIPNEHDTTDYNYETSLNSLNVVSPASEQKGGRVFEYPGIYATLDQGEKLAQFRTEEVTWDSAMIKGQSTVLGFSPHMSFTLEHHPRDEWNQGYILYKIVHRLRFHDPEGRNELVYDNTFWAFPDNVPFRPKRRTRKPLIHSHQTAKVVGPEGEEVYTDEFGRIKIQFHWDNYGSNDDSSSIWVRVAQTWAGSGWGAVITPRIGMEVVVSFINGDPDRPLVVGCVYNSNNPPPYDLESPTKSVWRTQSSPDAAGYNELSFEDAAGDEEIFMHAQRNVRVVIQNEREELIVDGDDTLTMTSGSKYEYLHGTGVDHNTVVDDGCRLYNIIKGDYSIIIGTQDGENTDSDNTDTGSSSVDSTVAAAGAATAAAQERANAAAAIKAAADAAVRAARQAADLATQRANNGTGTVEESLAASENLQKQLAAAANANKAYQDAQNELSAAQANEALTHSSADLAIAQMLQNKCQQAQDDADASETQASVVYTAAQAAYNAVQAALQAKNAVALAYKNQGDTKAATALAVNQASIAMRLARTLEIEAKTALDQASQAVVSNQNAKSAAKAYTSGDPETMESLNTALEEAGKSVSSASNNITNTYLAAQGALQSLRSSLDGDANTVFRAVVVAAGNSVTSTHQAVEEATIATQIALDIVTNFHESSEDLNSAEEDETNESDDDSEITEEEGDTVVTSSSESDDMEEDSSESGQGSSGGGSSSSGGGVLSSAAAVIGSVLASDDATTSSGISEGVGGDFTLFLQKGDGTVTLRKGDYTITLSKGDMTIDVTGDISISASGDIDISAGGDITLDAGGDISMSAGGSIDMTASLSIDGMAGLAIGWMAGLAVESMAALAVESMGLLMGELSSPLLVNVGGKATTKVTGAAVSIAMPG